MAVRKSGNVLLGLGLLSAIAVNECRSEAQGKSALDKEAAAAQATASEANAGGKYADFRTVFTGVSRKVVPSVVSIATERTVTAPQNPFDFFGGGGEDPFEFFFGDPHHQRQQTPQRKFRESGLGSGFFAGNEGYILTNNHVVEGAQKLKVQLSDEREFDAEVVGTDNPTDIAVIRIKGKAPSGITPLPFGDSDKLQIGEWVVAVGAPFGLYESVTTGIISAKGRQNTGITAYGNFLQTDAAINPGNSGGPLVNLDGEIIGINTAIYSQSGGYMGIGFAIPVNLAKTVMDNLVKHGKVTRGWLGVSIQSLTPDMADALGLKDRKGALIGDVLEGGPADKAGLKRGDVVTALQGVNVTDANDLMNRVALIPPGSNADVTVLREGKQMNFKVKIAKRDESKIAKNDSLAQGPEGGGESNSADVAALGLSATDLGDAARQQYGIGKGVKEGAVVTQVDPSGGAADAGVQEGDVIVEAGRKRVASAADLGSAVKHAPRGKGVLLVVNRKGATFFVVVTPK